MRKLSRGNCRLFRNNVGMGWTGNWRRTQFGEVVIKNPRPLHAGLCKGSSDLVGWETIEITADMVGQKVAVFRAVELKTGKDSVKKEQKRFIDAVNKAGGRAKVIRK